jgi:hypothetical protein
MRANDNARHARVTGKTLNHIKHAGVRAGLPVQGPRSDGASSREAVSGDSERSLCPVMDIWRSAALHEL